MAVKKSELRKIRRSLTQQLEEKGANVAHFESMIDSYLFLHEQEMEMRESILQEGRIIPYVSSTGKESTRENPAVKGVPMYNQAKLRILRELGLTTDACTPPDEGGDL